MQDIDWSSIDKTKFFVNGLGLFSGVTTMLFPLSVIKTRQMASHGVSGGFRGTKQTAQTVWRNEGVPGFYRGFGTVIFGTIPARTIYLTSLEITKSAAHKLGKQLQLSDTTTAGVANFTAGALASLSTQMVTVPIDVVSQRQMVYGTDISRAAKASKAGHQSTGTSTSSGGTQQHTTASVACSSQQNSSSSRGAPVSGSSTGFGTGSSNNSGSSNNNNSSSTNRVGGGSGGGAGGSSRGLSTSSCASSQPLNSAYTTTSNSTTTTATTTTTTSSYGSNTGGLHTHHHHHHHNPGSHARAHGPALPHSTARHLSSLAACSPSGNITSAQTLEGATKNALRDPERKPLSLIAQRGPGLPGTRGLSGVPAAAHGVQVGVPGGLQIMRVILQQEGLLGLYRGFSMSVATFVPSSAVWWSAYGVYQQLIARAYTSSPFYSKPSPNPVQSNSSSSSAGGSGSRGVGEASQNVHSKQQQQQEAGEGSSLLSTRETVVIQTGSSMLAGATSSLVTNPLDLIKTRIQVAHRHEGQPATFRAVLSEIVTDDGALGLFRGVLPRMANAALWGTMMVTVYEFLKRISKKEETNAQGDRPPA